MRTSILYMCVLLLSSTFCFGQTPQFSFVESLPGSISSDTTWDANGNPILSVTVEKFMNCELSDTTNISTIRIKLGSDDGQSDLLNQDFDFGGQVISPTMYMERIGLGCRFRLGSFTNRDIAYLHIEALSSGGAVITSWQGLLN